MDGIEIHPNVIMGSPDRPVLGTPMAKTGGGLFAITAEWCGYCKKLKNSVQQARGVQPFDFFWMDGDKSPAHKKKAVDMKVEGFPTLYYIERGGQILPYTGGREPSDLVHVFHSRR
jgi:thiol-disulfide isomerase/thioredoxin